MKRREFITLLGSAAAWPLAARAQQAERVRRVGWLGVAIDPGSFALRAALGEGLAKLGWIDGRNLRIDLRVVGEVDQMGAYAAELVSLRPDVIITSGGAATGMVSQQTQTIPIVFTAGGDPVVAGFVRNIDRPEGNITGFSNAEPSIAGKWLELLKEAAPHLARVGIAFNSVLATVQSSYIASVSAAAQALGVKALSMPARTAADIVSGIEAFAAEPNGGLVVLPPSPGVIRDTIVPLAARHRLPAIYPSKEDAAAGGLLAYAPDRIDQARRAASYVDRLLRGAKVAELPVQFPTKYELLVNLKTAKAIGLTVPPTLLARADEVIE
jgi:putative ABC transport system substrate-binding protein